MLSAKLPRRFGRYALFDFIGKGGMAEIYLARAETELGASRLCVVKEILPELADDRAFSDMLVFEAKLAARLNHANIVQVFDLGRTEGRLYIAMEYVEGYDLNALLRTCSRKKIALPLEHALCVILEMLRGLDYAHRARDDESTSLGVVHRDVSPSNVLVSLDGEVKLCDFGIAKANALVAVDDGELGAALRGKAGYMSPEHARGEAIDARADVFAAGIVLWELLAGRRMYRATESDTLLDVARRAIIPALPERALPEMSRLTAIVDKALAVDSEARYQSAAAMQRDLEDYLAAARLIPNPLRFGEWLRAALGTDLFEERRERELSLTPSGKLKMAARLEEEMEFSSLEPTAAQPAASRETLPDTGEASPPTAARAEEPAAEAERSSVTTDEAEPDQEPESSEPEDPDAPQRFEFDAVPASQLPVHSVGAMRTFARDLAPREADDDEPSSAALLAAIEESAPARKSPVPLIVMVVVVLALLVAVAFR